MRKQFKLIVYRPQVVIMKGGYLYARKLCISVGVGRGEGAWGGGFPLVFWGANIHISNQNDGRK